MRIRFNKLDNLKRADFATWLRVHAKELDECFFCGWAPNSFAKEGLLKLVNENPTVFTTRDKRKPAAFMRRDCQMPCTQDAFQHAWSCFSTTCNRPVLYEEPCIRDAYKLQDLDLRLIGIHNLKNICKAFVEDEKAARRRDAFLDFAWLGGESSCNCALHFTPQILVLAARQHVDATLHVLKELDLLQEVHIGDYGTVYGIKRDILAWHLPESHVNAMSEHALHCADLYHTVDGRIYSAYPYSASY